MTQDEEQTIVLNLLAAGDTVNIFTNRIASKNKVMQVIVETDEPLTPVNNNVSGVVKSTTLRTDPIFGDIEEVGGKFFVSFESTYDNAPPCPSGIKVTLNTPPTGDMLKSFQVGAYRQGLEISKFAYTMNVRTLNVSPFNPVKLTMTVSTEWVTAAGGKNAVRIMRVTDEGQAQILETKTAGYDQFGNVIFTAESPDGFSTFGLLSLRPAAVIPPLPTIPTIIPRTTSIPTTAAPIANVTVPPAPVEETPFLFIAAAIVVLVVAVGFNLYIFRKR